MLNRNAIYAELHSCSTIHNLSHYREIRGISLSTGFEHASAIILDLNVPVSRLATDEGIVSSSTIAKRARNGLHTAIDCDAITFMQ